MPVKPVDLVGLKRLYPHVDDIPEFGTQATVRLLWDRVFSLTEQLTAAQTDVQNLIKGHNDNEISIRETTTAAQRALSIAATDPPTAQAPFAGGGGGGAAPTPGGGDGGEGNEGCGGAGASGHDSGGVLSAIRAGQIICGTGAEFSALRNPTATLAEREANAEELVERMIWHLRLAGFTAGRQNNSVSGVRLSKDKLAVVVNGVLRAYDVFRSYDTFTSAMVTQLLEIFPARMRESLGIGD